MHNVDDFDNDDWDSDDFDLDDDDDDFTIIFYINYRSPFWYEYDDKVLRKSRVFR